MKNQSKLTRNRSWSKEEDDKLRRQINATEKLNWKSVAKESGLERSANSCRLRWINHLKPGYRPDRNLNDEEKLLILELRYIWGSRNCWSKIAKHLLPGRRDNDVKNFWHSLAKRARREGLDVDNHAFLKRVELMETIKAAGKFTVDYSSLILPVAFNKLKELLPNLPVAGGGAVGSSSITTDIGAASSIDCGSHLGRSCYSVESGPSRNYSDFSNIGPTTEGDQNILEEQILAALGFNSVQAAESGGTAAEIENPEQLVNTWLVDDGGVLTVQAAQLNSSSTETSNQGWSQMQVTSSNSIPAWNITSVDAPQFHAPAEQHQQLGFNGEDFYLGGAPPNSTKRQRRHSTTLGTSTSIKTLNGYSLLLLSTDLL